MAVAVEAVVACPPMRRVEAASMLPLLIRRLGFDPASASAPFVATLVDVSGLVIYFSIAEVLLRGTLL